MTSIISHSLSLQSRPKYRPEIDGLRAMAVVSVIVNHFNQELLPSGYLGVDIFFVISGFVITSSIASRHTESFTDFLTGFYQRRVKRLVPALVTCIVITSFLICLFDPSPGVSLRTGIASLFGFSNLYLLQQSTDYFAASTNLNTFTHTWSLGVEEQFYLLFPLLAWLSGFARGSTKGFRNLFWSTAAFSIASLIGFISLYSTAQPAAYFLMPTRLWEMGAGCLLFLVLQRSNTFLQFLSRTPALLTSFALISIFFLPVQFAVGATLSIVLLTMLLIASLRSGTTVHAILSHKSLVNLGLISYSLYLWHWSVLSLSRWTIGIHWWSVPFQVALIWILAVLSHRYVETPLRHATWSVLRWRSIVYGLGISAASALCLMGLGKFLSTFLYSANYPFEHLITTARDNAEIKSNYSARKCHIDVHEHTSPLPLGDCQIKPMQGQKTFYFLGNSHANHFRTVQFLLASKHQVGIDGITTTECIFPHLSHQKDCGNVQQKQEERILRSIRKGDVVVIVNRYALFYNDHRDSSKLPISWIEKSEPFEEILNFNQKVREKEASLIVFAPTPEFPIELRECLPQWYKPKFSLPGDCRQSLATLKRLRGNAYKALSNLPKDILVYDPSSNLCIEGECKMVDSLSKPLYIDSDHLSDYANSEYIYQDFEAFLKQYDLLENGKMMSEL